MKFCAKCGNEIMDEAVICPNCGCAVENKEIIKGQRISTFDKNRKEWIIALTILFVVFASATVLLLISSGFQKAHSMYLYLNSDLAQWSNQFSLENSIRWQQEFDAAKATITSYYIGIGACGALALTALVGNILLFISRKKAK